LIGQNCLTRKEVSMKEQIIVTAERDGVAGSGALLSDEVLDSLMAKVEADGLELVGPGGVLAALRE